MGGRPNILYVNMDDMRHDFLQFMPNVRRWVGGKGRTWTRAYVQSAVCPTSRFSMFTGRAHHAEATTDPSEPAHPAWSYQTIPDSNSGGTAFEEHSNNFARWLQEIGYQTCMLGKYMNFSAVRNPIPDGWDYWREIEGDDAYARLGYGISDGIGGITNPADPLSKYLCDQAQTFITGANAAGAPWMCYIGSPDPHYPFSGAPEDEFYNDLYTWPLRLQTNFAGMPSWADGPALATTPESLWPFELTAHWQMKECLEFDRRLGLLFTWLDANVDMDNTYVFFSSDNGMYYGEHGFNVAGISKNDFYEHSARVPLVARGPGILRGVSDAPVLLHADITQTIIETTGCQPEGRQFPHRESLTGPENMARTILLTRGANTTGSFITPVPYAGECVVDQQYKVSRYRMSDNAVTNGYPAVPIATDTVEMYDILADPDEWVNLGNSVDAGIVAARNQRLALMTSMMAAP